MRVNKRDVDRPSEEFDVMLLYDGCPVVDVVHSEVNVVCDHTCAPLVR